MVKSILMKICYLEYYYLKNHKESADYYKISSADENSLP